MKTIKMNYLLFTILSIGLFACQADQKNANPSQPSSEEVIEQIKSLSDTVLTSKNVKQNEFQSDLSKTPIDIEKNSKIIGEYQAHFPDQTMFAFSRTLKLLGDSSFILTYNMDLGSEIRKGDWSYNKPILSGRENILILQSNICKSRPGFPADDECDNIHEGFHVFQINNEIIIIQSLSDGPIIYQKIH